MQTLINSIEMVHMAKPQEMREFIMADLYLYDRCNNQVSLSVHYSFFGMQVLLHADVNAAPLTACSLAFSLLYIDAVVQFHAFPSFRNWEGPFHHAILPFCYCGVGYRIAEWQNRKTAEWNGPSWLAYFHLLYLKNYVLSDMGKYTVIYKCGGDL